MEKLSSGHCLPCEGGQPTLTAEQIKEHLKRVPEWSANKVQASITPAFRV